jgi:hypothetical protein
LGLAVSERPVFLLYFNQTDKDIFAREIQRLVKSVGHGLVEGLFGFRSSPCVEGDLNKNAFVGPVNAKILSVKVQTGQRMLL